MFEIALSQLGGINHAFGRYHPCYKLIGAHLKRKDCDRIFVLGSPHVTCDIQCKSRLTHGRAGCKDDQIVAVEAGCHEVEVSVACRNTRSEEHTSELQSRFDLVCRLLLEKKN